MRTWGSSIVASASSVSGPEPLSTTITSYGSAVCSRIDCKALIVNSGAFQLNVTIETRPRSNGGRARSTRSIAAGSRANASGCAVAPIVASGRTPMVPRSSCHARVRRSTIDASSVPQSRSSSPCGNCTILNSTQRASLATSGSCGSRSTPSANAAAAALIGVVTRASSSSSQPGSSCVSARTNAT